MKHYYEGKRMKKINDLGDLLGQAQQMQAHMQQLQTEITKTEVVGESGAGLVRLTMNGAHEVLKVSVDPSLMNPEESEILEELIAAAANDAARRVEAAHQKKMSEMAGGLGGLGGLARKLSG